MGVKDLFSLRDAVTPDKTVTVHKNKRLVMEGCRRITFCQSDRVVLEGNVNLEIHGRGLLLKELGNDVIGVEGTILAVVFREAKE